ncbi:hypothetical protein GQ53DRAFT_792592 [Thozetella sp. PMI_491]|nr:hypothetical protein GQ53DRAFT_792592 [Thozetella sp. PMI_491]
MGFFRLGPWAFLSLFISTGFAADPDTLGLQNGYIDFETKFFKGKLVNDTQVLVSLSPKSDPIFDFLPFDKLSQRADDGNNHLGDVNFRYRVIGEQPWVQGSSSIARQNVTAMTVSEGEIAVSDLAPSLNDSLPLRIVRSWTVEDEDLVLSFNITNIGGSAVEIGALGFPIENNNIFTRRSKTDVQANCSFADPYIGLDGGYVQVTRVSGADPALVITPVGRTPFEAWSYLFEDSSTHLSYQSNLFEGLWRWDVYSKALAEEEWSGAEPWNPPTSKIIQPSQSLIHGLRFSLSSEIEGIEAAVASKDVPVITAFPGLIIPTDMTARLDISSSSNVQAIEVEPPSAMSIEHSGPKNLVVTPSASASGRVRVTVTYEDGRQQTVQYYLVKPGPEAVADLGQYLNDHHWYASENDAFGRGPSFMLVDHKTNDVVLQEYRVWLVGICHEAGASWMVAAIKQISQPNREQLAKLEEFVEKTLWGDIEEKPSYAVPYSLFWYSPDETDFPYDPSQPWKPGVSYSWPKKTANKTDRAYGYVYPTIAYWSLYRVARSVPDALPKYTWDFYLRQAYETVNFCFTQGNGTNRISFLNVGLMGETIIAEVLKDLQREGWTAEADQVKSLMKARADQWAITDVPFGSEQPWDCTGQEGVYYWSNYFNYTTSVTKTIDSIRGYMPAIAHWGYNGNARRYWDFTDGGAPETAQIERQIHHYGSALNALPLLHHLRSNTIGPTPGRAVAQSDQHLLRLAFAGSFAPLANIHPDGFASAAFHAYPETLAWDSFSGDYGPGFVGMMLGAATYVVGGTGGDLTVWGGQLLPAPKCTGGYDIVPQDAVRMRVFVGPLGLWIEVSAGAIEKVRVVGEKVLVKVVAAAVPDAVAVEEAIVVKLRLCLAHQFLNVSWRVSRGH